MLKIKTASAFIVVLILALSAGNSASAEGISVKTGTTAYNESITEPAPEPSVAPEPTITPEPTLSPEPTLEPTPKPIRPPGPPPETKPNPIAPPKGCLFIFLPDIPKGTPAPRQIKRLPASGMVCLTFDDGYSKSSIKKILKCLRENDVQCTFFVIGACLKRYPDLWRQAVADGHEIAYHTMNHYSLNRKTNKQIVKDMNKWNAAARKILGRDYRIPMIARAPGGSANKRVRRLFTVLGIGSSTGVQILLRAYIAAATAIMQKG